MLPLLTFASGLVAGIVGVRLLKTVKAPDGLKAATGTIGDKARHGIDQAQTSLRQATVSSLTAIERSSASLRAKLAPEAVEPAAKPAKRRAKAAPKAAPKAKVVAAAAPEPVPQPESEPKAKPAAKRRSKAKPATPDAGAGS